jgi:hypothetical protein
MCVCLIVGLCHWIRATVKPISRVPFCVATPASVVDPSQCPASFTCLIHALKAPGSVLSSWIEYMIGFFCLMSGFYRDVQDVQLKSGPYFNMNNLCTKIYNMLYYTTNLYLQ